MFEDESDDFDDETEYGSNEEEEEESTKTTLNKMDADSKKSYYKYRRKAHEHKLYWNHKRKQYMPKLDDPNIVWPKKNPILSSRKYYIKLALVSAKVTTIEEMEITIMAIPNCLLPVISRQFSVLLMLIQRRRSHCQPYLLLRGIMEQ